MKLVTAKPADSNRLNEFFRSIPVPSQIDVAIDRQPDFFAHYSIFSKEGSTFLLENETAEIQAMATILYRDAYLAGEKHKVGFACDLRVASSRRATLEWSKILLPALDDDRRKKDCQFVFTVVARSQRQAYNALIRPRSMRRTLPRYYLYRKFHMHCLHGRLPFAPTGLPFVKISACAAADEDAWLNYVAQKNQSFPFCLLSQEKEVKEQLSRWKGLSLNQVLIAKDKNGNIVGCVAPWKLNSVASISALSYPPQANSFKNGLRLMSLFGLAHPLPKVHKNISLIYLSFLRADNHDIFYSLLDHVYRHSNKEDVLAYLQFEDDLLLECPRTFLSTSHDYGLYFITSPAEPLPQFLTHTNMVGPVEFELAFI